MAPWPQGEMDQSEGVLPARLFSLDISWGKGVQPLAAKMAAGWTNRISLIPSRPFCPKRLASSRGGQKGLTGSRLPAGRDRGCPRNWGKPWLPHQRVLQGLGPGPAAIDRGVMEGEQNPKARTN